MNCWPSEKYVNLLYMIMYSILGRVSFCFIYCLNLVWHGGDTFLVLLRWYGSPGFFDSRHLSSSAFFGLLFLISLLSIPYIFSMVSLLASQAHQHLGHLTNFGAYGSVGRCHIMLEMKSVSLKSWSAEGSMKCSKMYW